MCVRVPRALGQVAASQPADVRWGACSFRFETRTSTRHANMTERRLLRIVPLARKPRVQPSPKVALRRAAFVSLFSV